MLTLTNLNTSKDIIYGISDRSQGNMSFKYGKRADVLANRRRFFAALNIDENKILKMNLDQSSKIAVLTKKQDIPSGLVVEADAVITNIKDLFLFLLIGDCAPFFFFDPNKKVIALAHVGWGGTVGKLPVLVLARMASEFGSSLKDILIGIGPSLCDQCDIQPNPIQQAGIPEWKNYLHSQGSFTRIELRRFMADELAKIGIQNKQIEASNICTREDFKQFFSHEAAQAGLTEEGRFGCLLGLKP